MSRENSQNAWQITVGTTTTVTATANQAVNRLFPSVGGEAAAGISRIGEAVQMVPGGWDLITRVRYKWRIS